MKISRPSPALVVSIIALVVACTGTATAASVIIKSSAQVKAHSLQGSDIKNRSITGLNVAGDAITSPKIKDGSITSNDLSSGLKGSLGGVAGGGITGTEAVRKQGPQNQSAGAHQIATVSQLAPGTYALFAKTTITPNLGNDGLGELLRQSKTVNAECVLEAGGDQDNARQTVASPGSVSPSTVNLQLTRTLSAPTDVKVSCTVNDYTWSATDTSIIALKLSGTTRQDVSN